MKAKGILFGIVITLVFIVLFNNKEEATFWLFGEIRTSKLFILGIFFLLGMVTGGIVFRRRRTHPKEYNAAGQYPADQAADIDAQHDPYSHLSAEDRKFLGKED